MKKIMLLYALIAMQPLCQAMNDFGAGARAPYQGIWQDVPTEVKVLGAIYVGSLACVFGFIHLITEMNKKTTKESYEKFEVSYRQLTQLHRELEKRMVECSINIQGPIPNDIILDILCALCKKLPMVKADLSYREKLWELSVILEQGELVQTVLSALKPHFPCLKDELDVGPRVVDPAVFVNVQLKNAKMMLDELRGFEAQVSKAIALTQLLEQK